MEQLVADETSVAAGDEAREWDRSPAAGGSTATTVDPSCSKRLQAQDRKAANDEPDGFDRPDRKTGRIHAVIVIGEHAWGGDWEKLACRPLVEIAGKPLVGHVLNWLRRQGFESASVCANGHTRVLRRHLGDGKAFGVELDYYKDIMPRGPAGCVRDAAMDCGADTVLAISGTVLPRADLDRAFRLHWRTDAAATVVSVPGRGGSLEPSGLYLFSPAALESVGATGYQDVKETLLPQLRRTGRRVVLSGMAAEDLLRVTDVESYLRVNRAVVEESLDALCGADYVRIGDACVHESCEVEPSARLIGPVLVGPGCRLESDSVIVGPTSVGACCRIGAGAAISRSTIWAFCRVGKEAIIDNCLIGEASTLPDGQRVSGTYWYGDRQPGRASRCFLWNLR